jgi:hypothetical protein
LRFINTVSDPHRTNMDVKILDAAGKGDLEALKAAVAEGGNVNAVDPKTVRAATAAPTSPRTLSITAKQRITPPRFILGLSRILDPKVAVRRALRPVSFNSTG